MHGVNMSRQDWNEMGAIRLLDMFKTAGNDILQSKGQEKAISAANNSIRYSELNKQIEYLRGQIEFSGSGILLIKLDRTIENIALVLTCLIYDIPFIPVDSETPDDRIELIENLCGQKACNVNALINNIPNVAISTGSACTSGFIERSHVLKSLGLTDEEASYSFRIGIGKYNTEEEIEIASNAIINAVNKIKKN